MKDISAILIVEDDPTDVMLIKQAFKRANFRGLLKEVGTADLAYKWLVERLDSGEGLPELVLLDLGLPDETGMEMLAKLKGTPQLAKMRAVVFSGSRRPTDMAKARDLGADWYFVKQSSPRDLDFIVTELKRICSEVVG
jgi:two-component system, chemotaxis family, response regulator Rcp1